ncbi:thermonuclease NucI [Staphylococcus americanisciuri]|uniref:Thermonuclease n=1 Tax=Staphylococcus americanisciuri TaxID=2973940 RepID=A0ABT2EYN2_9STAP|nr:thermonuclease family protein [Staphylococcus americanisciuri]MCS4485349.1 thermonuclease family protein [Staphylococcus americanisciuri]
MNKKLSIIIVALVAIVVFGFQYLNHTGPFADINSEQNGDTYTVKRVVDGDTIIVSKAGKEDERVRLIGVDTPETVKPNTPVQPYGKEASDFTKKHLTNQTVRLEYDREKTDRYGRTLAYVWLGDDMFNVMLAKEGLARAKFYAPNDKYRILIEQAQKEAQKKQLNIWER